VSTIKDLTEGCFQQVIPDQSGAVPGGVKKIPLCAGKVYTTCRRREGADHVAIVRIVGSIRGTESGARSRSTKTDEARVGQERPATDLYYHHGQPARALHHRFRSVWRGGDRQPRSSCVPRAKMLIDEAFRRLIRL
jgi:hypothetical protein